MEALAALLSVLLASQSGDFLAPSRAGAALCREPHPQIRRCAAFSRFTPRSGGGFEERTTQVLGDDIEGQLSMTFVSQVQLTPGGLCGRVSRAEIMAGSLEINGIDWPGENDAPALAQVADRLESQGILGPMRCTRFAPDGDGLVSTVTVDGVPRPDLARRFA